MKPIYPSLLYALLFLSVIIHQGCSKSSDTPTPKSSAKTLQNPTIDGLSSTSATYDASTFTYTFDVSTITSVTALKVSFTLPTGATVKPASGSSQDFTNPVTYIVTAEDGTTQTYVIKVITPAQWDASRIYKVILAKGQSTTVTGLTSLTFNAVPQINPSSSFSGTIGEKSFDGVDALNIQGSTYYKIIGTLATFYISQTFNRTDGQNRPIGYYFTVNYAADKTTVTGIQAVKTIISSKDGLLENGNLPMIGATFNKVQ